MSSPLCPTIRSTPARPAWRLVLEIRNLSVHHSHHCVNFYFDSACLLDQRKFLLLWRQFYLRRGRTGCDLPEETVQDLHGLGLRCSVGCSCNPFSRMIRVVASAVLATPSNWNDKSR